MFQTVTANRLGNQRQETLFGRNYVVLPVRMLRQGVLNGSRGRLLYTEEEMKASEEAWNNIPIVIDHPKDNGRYVSARTPLTLDQRSVGYVFNATYAKGNLDAEAWIDLERLRVLNSELARKAEQEVPLEVSTGLGTENYPRQGSYEGQPYDFVARNYAPDHLALLTNETGACSVADGCGLSVNSSFLKEMQSWVKRYNEADSQEPFSEWLVANCKDGDTANESDGGCGCDQCKQTVNGEPEGDFTLNTLSEFDFVTNSDPQSQEFDFVTNEEDSEGEVV